MQRLLWIGTLLSLAAAGLAVLLRTRHPRRGVLPRRPLPSTAQVKSSTR